MMAPSLTDSNDSNNECDCLNMFDPDNKWRIRLFDNTHYANFESHSIQKPNLDPLINHLNDDHGPLMSIWFEALPYSEVVKMFSQALGDDTLKSLRTDTSEVNNFAQQYVEMLKENRRINIRKQKKRSLL